LNKIRAALFHIIKVNEAFKFQNNKQGVMWANFIIIMVLLDPFWSYLGCNTRLFWSWDIIL